jgi:N-acetylglucosaminyl-diphospho-decaprenol L-rhamnosyltransferase
MISAIIVTYNSRDHIVRCLESIQASGAEIVVVDNASTDGTADLVRQSFPTLKLMEVGRNLGFAAAANLGASNSSGTSLLFLNPDVICRGSLGALEQALESSPRAVAVAPRLVDSEGRTQIGFNVRRLPSAASLLFEILLLNRLFPNNPVNRRYRCLDLDPLQPCEVEQPAGACLLVRRAAFDSCGGFDERFFPLWFEDVDLCLRLRRAGDGRGMILYRPEIAFQHSGGHSLDSITFSERQVYWYRNLLYYVGKHFPWTTEIAVRAAVLFGLGLRLAAELFGSRKLSRTRTPSRWERICAYLRAAKLSLLGWR